MNTPKLVMFDLDGTLTESKQPLSDDMAAQSSSRARRSPSSRAAPCRSS